MNHDQRKSVWVGLPVTVAKHGNARLHFNQALLGSGKIDVARKEKCGERLNVSASQPAARPKRALGDNGRLLDQANLTVPQMEMASVIVLVCQVRTN
jgi:hypothetical protein